MALNSERAFGSFVLRPGGSAAAKIFVQMFIGESDMGDRGGSKDKGKKEKQKKAKLSPKEKRKAQKEKKSK